MHRPLNVLILAALASGMLLAQPPADPHARDLVQALDSPFDSEVRQARGELLAAGPVAASTLLLALAEGGHEARAEAVLILASIERERLASGEGHRYLPRIVAGLGDETEAVRGAAVRGLVYLGERGLPGLREAFAEPGAPATRYLWEVERTILRRRVEEELTRVISPDGGFGTYDGAFVHVGELGPGATAICLEMFENPRYEAATPALRHSYITLGKVRYLAGSALYEIAGDEIVPRLRQLYDEAQVGPGDPERLADFEASVATILSLHGDSSRFEQELQLRKMIADQSRRSLVSGSIFADVAEMYLKSNRNRSCVRWYRRAAEYDRYLNRPVYLYNIACAFSRMGELERGLAALEEAVVAGYAELSWLERDGDLDFLRGDPRFKQIVEFIESGGETALPGLSPSRRGGFWDLLLPGLDDED